MRKFVWLLLLMSSSAFGQTLTVHNGSLWYDTTGKDVQAHGAGFLKQGDKWYMVGEDRSGSVGVNLYSSTDLSTWKFEHKIVSSNTNAALKSGSRFIERPKLIYNAKTKKYVVWLHYEGAGYGPAEAGVFVGDSINADYKFVKGWRPLGNYSRDCNTFVDDDGTAYFYSSANNNADVVIYKLTDDYLDVQAKADTIFRGSYREALAIFKKDGKYYMVSSGNAGWAPNQNGYAVAKDSVMGTWSSQTNIGNSICYDTQSTSVLTIKGTEQTTYIYVGDRWQDPQLAESKTIMLPLSFSFLGTMSMKYYPDWQIDLTTGKWSEIKRTDILDRTAWKVVSYDSQNSSTESVSKVLDGNINTIWHTSYTGTTPKYPHQFVLDLGEEKTFSGLRVIPRQDGTNGLIRNFLLFASTDGKTWGTPVAGGWMPYYSDVTFSNTTGRYIKFVALSADAESQAFASMAEFYLIEGTTVKPTTIAPYYQIGKAAWQQGTDMTVANGTTVKFGPQPTERGSWCWSSPTGRFVTGREASISNFQPDSAGIYTAIYLNESNQVTATKFNVRSNTDTGIESTPALRATTAATYDVNGRRSEATAALSKGVYIVNGKKVLR